MGKIKGLDIRIWDKFKHKMVYEFSSLFFNYGDPISIDMKKGVLFYKEKGKKGIQSRLEDEYEMMFATGVKDKRGNMIYEGDVIDVDVNDKKAEGMIKRQVVVRDPQSPGSFILSYFPRSSLTISNSDIFQVLGNIYQNSGIKG